MLTTDRFLTGLRSPVTAGLIIAAVLLAPGHALAADSGSAEIEVASERSDFSIDRSELLQLQERLDSLSELNLALEADNSNLSQAVEDVTRHRDQLQDSLARFDELYGPLDADRQLLFELRKNLPETRVEAEAQLDRLERLALIADPSRLGQLVDRVADAAPAFLDWRFTEFASTQEASGAYVTSGANAFDSTLEELRDAVLLSVANRIDGLLTVIDRAR